MDDLSFPQLGAIVTHKPGAIRLDGFHLLVHAPEQWGEGVRTENNGTRINDIIAAHEGDFTATARRFGVTEDHVRQALAYAMMYPS